MLSGQDIVHNYSLPVVYSYKRYEYKVPKALLAEWEKKKQEQFLMVKDRSRTIHNLSMNCSAQ